MVASSSVRGVASVAVEQGGSSIPRTCCSNASSTDDISITVTLSLMTSAAILSHTPRSAATSWASVRARLPLKFQTLYTFKSG